MSMPVLAKMKEILNLETYNSRVLKLNGLRENQFVSSTSATKELSNIDRNKESEKGEEEERLREGEEILKKTNGKGCFL